MKRRWLPWLLFGATITWMVISVALEERSADVWLWMLPFVAHGAIGTLVVSRQPRNRLGWVYLLALVFLIASVQFQEALRPALSPTAEATFRFLSSLGWVGGLGSMLGSFLGAAFVTALPILLTNAPQLVGVTMPTDLQKHLEVMIFGGLIIFFLIVEPHGLARLWQIAKEKLRRWPFPY